MLVLTLCYIQLFPSISALNLDTVVPSLQPKASFPANSQPINTNSTYNYSDFRWAQPLKLAPNDDFPPIEAYPTPVLSHILVTAFDPGQPGSGTVWVVPLSSPDHLYPLLSGLDLNIGLCFDEGHSVLYVFDEGLDGRGRVYRYVIARNDGRFELDTTEYYVVYDGEAISDCAVDPVGNLYMASSVLSGIYTVGYADLWSGYRNQHVTVYAGRGDRVDRPIAIETAPGDTLIWVNAGGKNASAAVIEAPSRPDPSRPPIVLSYETDHRVLAVSVSYSMLAWAFADGSVQSSITGERTAHTTYLGWPTSMCQGGGRLYVGDADLGTVFELVSGEAPFPGVVARVARLAAIECVVAGSVALGVSLFLLN